jgi:hypothetical protein
MGIVLEQERAAKSRTEILKVACSAADSVNIAFYQNAIPVIRELAIENELGPAICRAYRFAWRPSHRS